MISLPPHTGVRTRHAGAIDSWRVVSASFYTLATGRMVLPRSPLTPEIASHGWIAQVHPDADAEPGTSTSGDGIRETASGGGDVANGKETMKVAVELARLVLGARLGKLRGAAAPPARSECVAFARLVVWTSAVAVDSCAYVMRRGGDDGHGAGEAPTLTLTLAPTPVRALTFATRTLTLALILTLTQASGQWTTRWRRCGR
jgi:hypothetical protein